MKTLGIDIETFSGANIQKTGAYAYAGAPDFETLLIAYKFDHEKEVTVIDTHGVGKKEVADYLESIYPEFWVGLNSQDVVKTAFNANFERACLTQYLGIRMPPEQWRCTAVHAATLGLPRNLGAVCIALGLPEDKQKDATGKALINYFCKPCKPTKANGGRTRNQPEHNKEKWETFIEYNRQDVVAEQEIQRRLSIYPVTEEEQKLWDFDQRMNDLGISVDMDMINGIVSHDGISQARLLDEAKYITGLANPNSLAQLKKWLAEKGCTMTSITKDTTEEMLKNSLLETAVRRMLEIRKSLGKTSIAKYTAMQNAICSDGKLRGVLQFYGANRTGRWSSKIVQLHNLPQNKIPDIDLAREFTAAKDFASLELLFGESAFVFSQLIRTAFTASPDSRFVISDFSAIEARVIAWLAGEQWRMDVFNTHGKIYETSASQMFHVPIEGIKKGSRLRQQGKIAELALGYQGAFGAIKKMDKEESIPDDEIPILVSNWRAANPAICKFWYICENAAKAAIKEHRTIKIQHGLMFTYINRILFIRLPSGRKLAYYDARLEDNDKGKETITYAGTNQDTKVWGRLETYGGKLVENIVQAVARDCLAVAMMRVDKLGYKIVLHVHDEMVVDVPNSDAEASKVITEVMSLPIGWAQGLPLKGDTYETRFYKKD